MAPKKILGDANIAVRMAVTTRIAHSAEDFRNAHGSEKRAQLIGKIPGTVYQFKEGGLGLW
jgi:hypothetical protein